VALLDRFYCCKATDRLIAQAPYPFSTTSTHRPRSNTPGSAPHTDNVLALEHLQARPAPGDERRTRQHVAAHCEGTCYCTLQPAELHRLMPWLGSETKLTGRLPTAGACNQYRAAALRLFNSILITSANSAKSLAKYLFSRATWNPTVVASWPRTTPELFAPIEPQCKSSWLDAPYVVIS
jgi:hypothetical protein